MSKNPYTSQHKNAFWKNGVENSRPDSPENIHTAKWKINESDSIATMGSCFAQHIANWFRESGFNVPYYEKHLSTEDVKTFSANYGNIYTVKQSLQLFEEAFGLRTPSEIAWKNDSCYIDAFRPNAIKSGFQTTEDTISSRENHLQAVRDMVSDFDVLIFTLGLTEAWKIKACGSIIPTAPGVIAGEFNPDKYEFVNFKYPEIIDDLTKMCDLLTKLRNGRPYKLLLTVSPVPLTATATNKHILLASIYSKSVLRSVAGDFAESNSFVDYFPSFEIINNPAAKSDFFEKNLRSVKQSSVNSVMKIFSSEALSNPVLSDNNDDPATSFDPDCEDALLEEFSNTSSLALNKEDYTEIGLEEKDFVVVGNSHIARFRSAISPIFDERKKTVYFFPTQWAKDKWFNFQDNKFLTEFYIADKYQKHIQDVRIKKPKNLVFVGLGLAGDGICRAHGAKLPGDKSDSTGPEEVLSTIPVVNVLTDDLIEFYKQSLNRLITLAEKLEQTSPYESIFWIASPDISVDVAKRRFGEHFVESGSYIIHKEAYMKALDDLSKNLSKINFLFHSADLSCEKTGFTRNEYKASDRILDIHSNEKFYQGSIADLFSLIAKSKAS